MSSIHIPSLSNSLWIPIPGKKPHLAVVIATDSSHTNALLLVISTPKSRTKETPMLYLFPSDHSALSHKSYVRFHSPVLASASDYNRWANDRKLGGARDDFSMTLVHSFQRGFMNCPNVAEKYTNFATRHMVCAGCSAGNLYIKCGCNQE